MLINFGFIITILFLFISLNAIFVFRLFILKTKPKTIIIFVIFTNLFLLILFILQEIFPNKDCRIDLIINNKSDQAEIVINRTINYRLYENDTVIIDNIKKGNGIITVRTLNNAKIIYYNESRHIFTFSHRIRINIDNNDIKIKSFIVPISSTIFSPTSTFSVDVFDKMLETLNN